MHSGLPPLSSYCDGLLKALPIRGKLELEFDGHAVRALSNSEELLGELGRYFSPFRNTVDASATLIHVLQGPCPEFAVPFTPEPPEPGATQFKHEYLELPGGRVGRKRATGMHFSFDPSRPMAVGPCRENPHHVIDFINTSYCDRHLKRGALLCHAAEVAADGHGLVIAGGSGAGKSTLALHLVARGAALVSNDRVLLDSSELGLTLRGVPKFPRINTGTILHNWALRGLLLDRQHDRYGKLSPAELWDLEAKHDVKIDEWFCADRFRLSVPLKALVLFEWSANPSAMRVESLDVHRHGARLTGILKAPSRFSMPGGKGAHLERPVERLLECLRECELTQFSGGGSFEPAIQACRELLGTESRKSLVRKWRKQDPRIGRLPPSKGTARS